ncbi:MAG: phosphoenolpyruvate kinase [Polyangiales bacterium]
MSLLDHARAELEALTAQNRAFSRAYPGERAARQPVHTVYGGAQLFEAETVQQLGPVALASMDAYAPDPIAYARAIALPGAEALSAHDPRTLRDAYERDPEALRRGDAAAFRAVRVYDRVRAKLAREPVEDYRIDFEDGFGAKPDAEEDAVAVLAARAVGRAHARGILPPFVGIRIKSFGDEWKLRGARTLELFVDTLLDETRGTLPDGFVVTLPKVNLAEQPRFLVKLLAGLEARHRLAPGSLRMELMVETTQALVGLDGRSPLPGFLAACDGRCTGVHLGTYDFTASCSITAAYQTMAHPMCDLAKGLMVLAYGGTGVFLSDGATNVLPVGPHTGPGLSPAQDDENRAAVHRAWRLSAAHIRRSLVGGFYQGWDLHAAQLPVRFGTCFSFFLEGLDQAAERLSAFVTRSSQATVQGDILDDAATGQGLLNFFLRALNAGAIDEDDATRTGLTPEELALRSFARILEGRKGTTRG